MFLSLTTTVANTPLRSPILDNYVRYASPFLPLLLVCALFPLPSYPSVVPQNFSSQSFFFRVGKSRRKKYTAKDISQTGWLFQFLFLGESSAFSKILMFSSSHIHRRVDNRGLGSQNGSIHIFLNSPPLKTSNSAFSSERSREHTNFSLHPGRCKLLEGHSLHLFYWGMDGVYYTLAPVVAYLSPPPSFKICCLTDLAFMSFPSSHIPLAGNFYIHNF